MRPVIAIVVSFFAIVLLLEGCGATGTHGPVLQDSSGNRVIIGRDPNASVGPGSPGWPEPTPSQAGR